MVSSCSPQSITLKFISGLPEFRLTLPTQPNAQAFFIQLHPCFMLGTSTGSWRRGPGLYWWPRPVHFGTPDSAKMIFSLVSVSLKLLADQFIGRSTVLCDQRGPDLESRTYLAVFGCPQSCTHSFRGSYILNGWTQLLCVS